jgi:hypothetical protein
MANKKTAAQMVNQNMATPAAINVNGNAIANATEKARKRVTVLPVFNRASAAKKIFFNLPTVYQNAVGKRQAVDTALARDKKNQYPDKARFWDDVEAEGKRLDRAADLKEYCTKKGLNYVAVKQHIVLEGKGFINNLILNGIAGHEPLIDKFGDLLYDREKECGLKPLDNQNGDAEKEVRGE